MNPILRWFHQLGSPPYFDRFAARWAPWGYGLGLLVMAVGMYWGLFHTPADYQQGDSFRILYIHVPSAWMSMAVYGLMAVYAVIAQVWRIKLCEILAMACAPIGAAFTLITLLTGNTQERVARPLTCTVQAPHWAMPQPYLVPVRPRVSRSTHNSGVPGSAST